MKPEPEPPQPKSWVVTIGVRLLLALLLSAGQTCYIVTMYWARVRRGWAVSRSDFLVFALPFILNCVGNFLILRQPRDKRLALGLWAFIAIVLAFLAFWAAMVWALNTWGS
jgi:hypothetical protein